MIDLILPIKNDDSVMIFQFAMITKESYHWLRKDPDPDLLRSPPGRRFWGGAPRKAPGASPAPGQGPGSDETSWV